MLLQPCSALARYTIVFSLALTIALAAPAAFPDSVRITSVNPEDGKPIADRNSIGNLY